MKPEHLLLVAALLFVTGCDTFFTLRGTVHDYRTGAPVPGARATLVLESGGAEDDHIGMTDGTGRLSFVMNEPPGVWATLTVTKTNYGTWSTQFRGAPRSEIEIRLVPLSDVSQRSALASSPSDTASVQQRPLIDSDQACAIAKRLTAQPGSPGSWREPGFCLPQFYGTGWVVRTAFVVVPLQGGEFHFVHGTSRTVYLDNHGTVTGQR